MSESHADESQMPSTTYLWIVGIVMTIFGVIAIGSPMVAGTAVVWVIGALLTGAGIIQFFQAWKEESWGSKLGGVILGALSAICGIGVLGHPLLGLSFLTLLLASFFVVEGIWKIIASFSYRPATGWIGLLCSGIIGLILGGMIWSQWPLSGMWAVGILVGVDLLMTGASMIGLALTVNAIKKEEEKAGAMPAEG